ncbi:PIN domain-containing protein [Deinococcus lacus]|uniref:Ribonuclease VapC n=1 Tax=Deinococcus lacus TaxID=392561 RepID=A0ABW1YAU2_9DEIO
MTLYSLDTNVISAVIDGDETVKRRWLEAKAQRHTLSMSAFVYYEVKRGLDLPRRARKYAAFQGIVTQTQILVPDVATYDIAAEIYQKLKASGKPIGDADIIIAATALRYGAVLVTRNQKHMKQIDGLELENWHPESPKEEASQ